MPSPLLVEFRAGPAGDWTIDSIKSVVGDTLPYADRLTLVEGAVGTSAEAWSLRGVISHLRYTQRSEVSTLVARQEGLGRSAATCAALIPIRKNAAWWALAQDERRAIFEEHSHHIAIGMDYLPGVARRLHHSRDLGEPFDFLTWFEYAPEQSSAFEDMVMRLRDTNEWRFVDREVDIRLSRS